VTVLESYNSDACDTFKHGTWIEPIPIYYQLNEFNSAVKLSVEQAAVYEEKSPEKVIGEMGQFNVRSKLSSGIFSAEFKIDTTKTNSIGFIFREHEDEKSVANDGWSYDAFVIRYKKGTYGDTIEWSHRVRNRFVTELTYKQTNVASGSIYTSKLKTGPRGWNELGLVVDGAYAEVFFNRELIATLSLEEVKPGVSYFNSWVNNYFTGDVTADTYIRKPDIACPL
tara:strand:+ start:121 stop:795 length:675 start_codon:yes stop_codon:yes gene_type:complete